MDTDIISIETEYKELNTTIRHYSSMRFLIIPIFLGINGALFIGVQGDKIHISPQMYFVLFAFSLILSFVFSVLEFVLNLYMERFLKKIRALKPDGFWRERPDTRNIVTICIILLYFSVSGCWLILAVFRNFFEG